MKRWTIKGRGRKHDAIGIFYYVEQTYQAATAEEALTKHREHWDQHLQPWVVTETPEHTTS